MKHLIILLIICFFILSAVSCNGDSEVETPDSISEEMPEVPRLMMQPGNEFLLTPVGHLPEEYKTHEHPDRDAVRSLIFVQSTDSISVMREYQRGKLFRLSLDEDLQITAQINRNQAMGERIRNLSASILNPYEGVVTLVLEEDRLTGNIDLVSENRLFHLRYDSLSGLHYLAEIDREKLDVIGGDDPLEFE